MIYTFVGGAEVTDNLNHRSLKITENLQQRANTIAFSLFDVAEPVSGERIKVYEGTEILTNSSYSVMMKELFQTNKFRVGDVVYFDFEDVGEETASVTSVSGAELGFTPSVGVHDGGRIGKKIFSGTVENITDRYISSYNTGSIEFTVSGVDETKYFDRKLWNDTLTSSTAKQIIEHFLTTSVNVGESEPFYLAEAETGSLYSDFRISFQTPTATMERLAKEAGYFWWIDYERGIHFLSAEATNAPFNIDDENSENFSDLKMKVDRSRFANRVIVRGATEVSTSQYNQILPTDGAVREWILFSKFKNLAVEVDTGSGFVSQSVGILNIDDESSFDYMMSFQEKAIRAATGTATLDASATLSCSYNEVFSIRVKAQDNASITAYAALVGGDGIVDAQTVDDSSITSRGEAEAYARSIVRDRSNPIITAQITTDYDGLHAGQLINIKSAVRNFDRQFVIQKVQISPITDAVNRYQVEAATTMFGVVEFFQLLFASKTRGVDNEDEIIDNVELADETVIVSEVFFQESEEEETETVTATETVSTTVTDSNFVWGLSAGNQLVWNHGEWR